MCVLRGSSRCYALVREITSSLAVPKIVRVVMDSGHLCESCELRLETIHPVSFQPSKAQTGCGLCDAISHIASGRGAASTISTEVIPSCCGYYTMRRSSNTTMETREGDGVCLNVLSNCNNQKFMTGIWVQNRLVTDTQHIPSPWVPLEYFRSLIRRCIAKHRRCDVINESLSSGPSHMLDCHNENVVAFRGDPYVTLSYVWGDTGKSEKTDFRGESFPQTIRDAMIATVALGYQYLWVDRYCIAQGDHSERRQQISVMDSIYRNSVLTIIAACGEGPDHGLPGISATRSSLFSERRTPDKVIRDVFMRHEAIKRSLWNQRGWTFQECIFAQRYLIFTDMEATFGCSTSEAWETSHLPELYTSISRDWIPMFPMSGTSNGTALAVQLLKSYSARQLSKDEDILNAVTGTLRALEQKLEFFRHCWGLPVLGNVLRNPSGTRVSARGRPWLMSLSFLISLGWKHPGSQRGLIHRRAGFPSWSWVGWRGPLDGFIWDRPQHQSASSSVTPIRIPLGDIHFDSGIRVKVCKIDKTDEDWATMALEDAVTRQNQLTRLLRITAVMTELVLNRKEQWDYPGSDCQICGDNGNGVKFTFGYPHPELLPSRGLAIHMPRFIRSNQAQFTTARYLIVGIIKGVYERLALHSANFPDNFFSTENSRLQTILLG